MLERSGREYERPALAEKYYVGSVVHDVGERDGPHPAHLIMDCAHEWAEGEISLPLSEAVRPCVYCDNCDTLVDLTVEPDPREI